MCKICGFIKNFFHVFAVQMIQSFKYFQGKFSNLITLTILLKWLTLGAWLGPECASADGYITVLKIQMKICKDGRQVKKESYLVLVFLLLPISIWSLSHKPTIENNYQMYLSGTVLKIFVRKFSTNYYQSIVGKVYF